MKAAVYDLDKDKQFLDKFELEMEDFDDCLTRTLDVYSEYLRSFVMMIQVRKREVCTTKSYFPLPGRHFSAYFNLPEKLA